MESVSNARVLIILFLMTFFLHVWAGASASTRCSVCGMDVPSDSKISFLVEDVGKHTRLCSFSCASKLHGRRPAAKLAAKDYLSGEWISANESFFLINSKMLADSMAFGMPPVVAAFKSAQGASETQKKFGGGETLKGFDAVRLRFK